MKKITLLITGVILAVCVQIPTKASAKVQVFENTEISNMTITNETVENNNMQPVPKTLSFYTENDAEDSFSIQSNPNLYSDNIANDNHSYNSWSEFSISEAMQSADLVVLPNGDVTGSYSRNSLETGTTGVVWNYTVNFTATPLSSGYGYKFKSIQSAYISVIKTWQLWTWCSTCTLDIRNCFHSMAQDGSSITVTTDLEFDVLVDLSSGMIPTLTNLVWTENLTHTTYIANGTLPE